MAVIDRFNTVVDIAKSLGDSDLKKALIEVRDELKALLQEHQRLQEENQALREENRILRAQIPKAPTEPPPKHRVKYERGAVWLVDDDGILRGPMCVKCWETKQEMHRALKQMQHFFMCTECGTVTNLPGVKPA
jgi:regulator of replication initiation timing